VSAIPTIDGRSLTNDPETEYDRDVDWLQKYCRLIQKGETTRLTEPQAQIALAQFHETAAYRGWELLAAAIMFNHVHVVVRVPGDPDPEKLLHSFKSYATRKLNASFGHREWWTASGSTRVKKSERSVRAAIEYVRHQMNPLVVWIREEGGLQASRPCQGSGEAEPR